MACFCSENPKNTGNGVKYTEPYDDEYDKEIDVIYDSVYSEETDKVSGSGTDICGVFVDGNEADYQACEDEDSLVERVWWLSKPPRIPRRTCVVSARRIQVMKERLSSTINAVPTLCQIMCDKRERCLNRRKDENIVVDYVQVMPFDGQKKVSCQEDSINIVPDCARTIDEMF